MPKRAVCFTPRRNMAPGMYEAVIGLEVHVQLDTRSKLFCSCPTADEAAPNTAVCPVCLGHPGTLPVINREAVRLGVRAARALGCEVHGRSVFARKQYFYPDLPKGYQISQFDRPFATAGSLSYLLDGERRTLPLTRIHLEEDAARSVHDERGTLVDYNRAGTPLAEIVTEPELDSAEAAEAALRMLHRVVTEAGVTRGDLQRGHFRCDANVSVRRPGDPLGVRTEIKNVNSFRFVAAAIRAEVARQIEVLDGGGTVVQHTRGWRNGTTEPMRSKETSSDYRYFPDPDLPALHIDPDLAAQATAGLGALPLDHALLDRDQARAATFREAHGLDAYVAGVLLATPELADFFEAAIAAGGEVRSIANWLQGDVLRHLGEGEELAQAGLRPSELARLDALMSAGTITRNGARDVFEHLWLHGGGADDAIEALGLSVVGDENELRAIVRDAVAKHPAEAEKYRQGKKKLAGFFMGLVMRATRGQADPALARRLVVEELDSI